MSNYPRQCPECFHKEPSNSKYCSQCASPLVGFAYQEFKAPKSSTTLTTIIVTVIVTVIAVAIGVDYLNTLRSSAPESSSTISTSPDIQAINASFSEEAAKSITGKIVAVNDGDTVVLLDSSNREIKVRLAGIDAPESGQDFGNVSKKNLSSLVFGRLVTVTGNKIDKYGRLVGKISVDGVDVNLKQIQDGLAWHYKKYESEQSVDDRSAYASAEIEAKKTKTGLWRMPNPISPWDFRADGGIDPELKDKFFGNKNSLIYHWLGCPGFAKIAEKNREIFDSWEEAEEAGYRAATNCSQPKPDPTSTNDDEVIDNLDELLQWYEKKKQPEAYYVAIPDPTPLPDTYIPPARVSVPQYSTESYSPPTPPTYRSSIPAIPSVPSMLTAICSDGTFSTSSNDSGTCSHHGGVKTWISDTPNAPRSRDSSISTSTYSPSYGSDTSYRPKTVQVRGYTRRDGTYVAPYKRSAPRRP